MKAKTRLFAVAVGAACLVTSAWALPTASMSRDTAATQVRDDDSGDVARRVVRGLEGRSSYRDHDERRGGWDRRDYRDHERRQRRFHDDD
jgi:hypothetical protein